MLPCCVVLTALPVLPKQTGQGLWGWEHPWGAAEPWFFRQLVSTTIILREALCSQVV